MAPWLIRSPEEWGLWSMLAARYRPILTLIRGAPWEDVQ